MKNARKFKFKPQFPRLVYEKHMTRPSPLLLLILFGLVKVKFIGIDNGYINSVSCSKRGTYT